MSGSITLATPFVYAASSFAGLLVQHSTAIVDPKESNCLHNGSIEITKHVTNN